MDIKKQAAEKERISKRLDELKKEITELGHDYISNIPKPIPLDEMIKKIKPWANVETSICILRTEVMDLPF